MCNYADSLCVQIKLGNKDLPDCDMYMNKALSDCDMYMNKALSDCDINVCVIKQIPCVCK